MTEERNECSDLLPDEVIDMLNIFILIMSIALALISFFLTGQVRKYAISRHILDIPNERSSHVVVTPRGGGLGFVVAFLLGLSILHFSGIIGMHLFLALAGGGVLLAVIGWKDDKHGLTPRVRSFFHFLAASWAVYWLGGFPAVNVGFTDLYFSWVGSIIGVIGTVWMINLYNFMDGVDGIAGTEAVSVALICGILLFGSKSPGPAAVCFLLAASVLGFLMWNWPPARIFMGDVGSGFLGFVFAVMAMWTEISGVLPFIIWMILLGVFIIDATVTLIKRSARGERLYEAHRSHVYQLAVQAGYSHKQVTCTVLLINVLLGLISISALKHIDLLLDISIGVAVMLIIAHTILSHRFNVKITKMNAVSKIAETEGHLSYAEVAALKDDK